MITITYGEIEMDVFVRMEPADPTVGYDEPSFTVEGIKLPMLQKVERNGVPLDLSDIEEFFMERYEEDEVFREIINDLVDDALRKEAMAAREDVV